MLGGRSAGDGGRRELIGRLQGDLGLYRGEFMEGFSLEDSSEFELWLERERARWRRVFGELCEGLSSLEGEEGLIAEAIGTARLWVRQAPLEEIAHRRLMELLFWCGGEREGPVGLRGLSEHPRQRAWDRVLYPDAAAGRSVAESGRGEGFCGCEPYTLSCSYCWAFGVGGAAGWPPGRVWCTRLRVSSVWHGTNARRGRTGGEQG